MEQRDPQCLFCGERHGIFVKCAAQVRWDALFCEEIAMQQPKQDALVNELFNVNEESSRG